MTTSIEELQSQDAEKVSQISFKVFFNISASWNLSTDDERILLGLPQKSTFEKWRNGEWSHVSEDALERISYVIGIYKVLRTIFPTEAQADAWPNKANDYFGGDSAMQVMLKGSVNDLSNVRRYLDSMTSSLS